MKMMKDILQEDGNPEGISCLESFWLRNSRRILLYLSLNRLMSQKLFSHDHSLVSGVIADGCGIVSHVYVNVTH